MEIKLRPYSETIKESMSKEDLIGWIVELEAKVERMGNLLRNFTDVVEVTAFSMAAPNPYTPKFIQLVCVSREELAKLSKP